MAQAATEPYGGRYNLKTWSEGKGLLGLRGACHAVAQAVSVDIGRVRWTCGGGHMAQAAAAVGMAAMAPRGGRKGRGHWV
jgi:hypothetical protein